MSFLQLSEDLQQSITDDFINPLDLVCWASSCKRIHQLSQARLKKHRLYCNQYSSISFGEDGEHEDGDDSLMEHPIDMIAIVEEDPWAAWYVRRASFAPDDGPDGSIQTEFSGTPETQSKLQALKTPHMSLVDNIVLSDDQKVEWQTELDEGGHSACFGILLTLLPDLRRLGLVGCGEVYKPFLDPVLRHAGAGGHDAILTRLQELDVQHWDTESGENIDVLDEIFAIPSVRKLSARMIGDAPENEYAYQGLANASNIEEVDFTCSILGHKDLAELLKPMTNLTRLDYSTQLPWECIGYEGGADEFREQFEALAKKMLIERGMLWRISGAEYGMVKIRKAELAHELDDTGDVEVINDGDDMGDEAED